MASNDVSGSVLSIIAAFSSGLEIFKKLREKRRAKKKKSKPSDAARRRKAESQLSNSLIKGRVEVQSEYERRVETVGPRFASGDVLAQASLAQTLLKLNTGLVSMISSFLTGGRNDARLDYQSLTNLSETSRTEAINALDQLHHRLSQSSLILHPRARCCQRCGSSKHSDCRGQKDQTAKASGTEEARNQRTRARSSSGSSKPTAIAKVVPKGSSQPQFALVRPRARRATSTSSSASSFQASAFSSTPQSLASTAPTTPTASPTFPFEDDSFPFPPRRQSRDSEKQVKSPRSPDANISRNRRGSSGSARPGAASARKPKAAPQLIEEYSVPHPAAIQITPPLPVGDAVTRVGPFELAGELPQIQMPLILPRRSQKPTPSAYSFLTDSTKLGEIPPHKQTTPPDYELMARLNAEAAAGGAIMPAGRAQESGKDETRKGGLRGLGLPWKFWRGKAHAD